MFSRLGIIWYGTVRFGCLCGFIEHIYTVPIHFDYVHFFCVHRQRWVQKLHWYSVFLFALFCVSFSNHHEMDTIIKWGGKDATFNKCMQWKKKKLRSSHHDANGLWNTTILSYHQNNVYIDTQQNASTRKRQHRRVHTMFPHCMHKCYIYAKIMWIAQYATFWRL